MEFCRGWLGGPAVRKLQVQFAVGVALLLVVECDCERKGFGAERHDARACADVDGNLRQDYEGLVDSARAVFPMNGLDDLADSDGYTVVIKLGPAFDRIGCEGSVEPAFVVNVVVRLLDIWASVIRARGSCFARDF